MVWEGKTCAICGGELCNENKLGLCRSCRMSVRGELKKMLGKLKKNYGKKFVEARARLIDEDDKIIGTVTVRV